MDFVDATHLIHIIVVICYRSNIFVIVTITFFVLRDRFTRIPSMCVSNLAVLANDCDLPLVMPGIFFIGKRVTVFTAKNAR
jgi:hypothetical protein